MNKGRLKSCNNARKEKQLRRVTRTRNNYKCKTRNNKMFTDKYHQRNLAPGSVMLKKDSLILKNDKVQVLNDPLISMGNDSSKRESTESVIYVGTFYLDEPKQKIPIVDLSSSHFKITDMKLKMGAERGDKAISCQYTDLGPVIHQAPLHSQGNYECTDTTNNLSGNCNFDEEFLNNDKKSTIDLFENRKGNSEIDEIEFQNIMKFLTDDHTLDDIAIDGSFEFRVDDLNELINIYDINCNETFDSLNVNQSDD